MSSELPSDPPKTSSRRKEPATNDLAARIFASQRRNAASASKPRERSAPIPVIVTRDEKSPKPAAARPSSSSPRKYNQSPRLASSKAAEVEPDEFSRRLRISSPRQPPRTSSHAKLYNPETDPIPLRRTAEPDSVADSDSTPDIARYTAKSSHRDASNRQLFDPRKDDPVKYLIRPTPVTKSSADYISASSTSTDANSVASSAFTLSSSTDNSSASSALFEKGGKPGQDSDANVFAVQLKRLYRTITSLEAKVKTEDGDENVDEGRVLLKGKARESEEPDGKAEREKWEKQISDHKQLAETIHNLLEMSLAPTIPASLRNIPHKYNIGLRLWSFGFFKLLESLRRAAFHSPLAMEHLQDFIYWAYTFYTVLLEEPNLESFKSQWLEALGDLARYRVAMAAIIVGDTDNGPALTTAAVKVATADLLGVPSATSDAQRSISNAHAARIDDSPSPSIGLAAAKLLDVEPEKERWRMLSKGWYARGLSDTPGTGKLHHHLGLLSREGGEAEELRSVYHFVKSMATLHPFSASREKVLPVWSPAAQARRSLPDASASELFVLMHGMLFTNIQLDDLQPTLARFMERLEHEGVEEREWVMMAVINITSVMEYGKATGVLKRIGELSTGADPAVRKRAPVPVEEQMDVDDVTPNEEFRKTQITPDPSDNDAEADLQQPASFKLAIQLTFTMLTHVLKHPTRKSSPYAKSTLNPYLTIVLTFLATLMKHEPTLQVLERSVPWEELAVFFAMVPRSIMQSQGLYGSNVRIMDPSERWPMLTSGCPPPLPEDWCLRGMQWVGRKVYERGFWKSGEDRPAEIEVLDQSEGGDLTDGHIEDDRDEESEGTSQNEKRWVRIIRCAVGISAVSNGLTWAPGTRVWKVEGELADKVQRWREDDQAEREAEEKRRMGTRWVDDSMDVDADDLDHDTSDDSEDDENDSQQVRELKERRRFLKNLLQDAQHLASSTPMAYSSSRPRSHRKESRPSLSIVPGYTVLVVDTNILLSSLSMLASVIESLQWTVVIPLPVIMELDGLSSNPSKLGEAAQSALTYLSSHIRSHSSSLKVQTSKGNYLTTLSVRSEQVDFTDASSDRNMDDLILKAAIWQDEHWIDRSAMLKNSNNNVSGAELAGAVKVVLLSLDRNLRLKARSRQLPAASEGDLASILATGT